MARGHKGRGGRGACGGKRHRDGSGGSTDNRNTNRQPKRVRGKNMTKNKSSKVSKIYARIASGFRLTEEEKKILRRHKKKGGDKNAKK